MRKVVLVSIYDKVAGEYSMPLSFTNIECAKRYFKQMKTNNLEDLELYHLADYDSELGIIYSNPDKILIMKGVVVCE